MQAKSLMEAGLYNQVSQLPDNFKDNQGLESLQAAFIEFANRLNQQNRGIIYAQQVHQDQVTNVSDLNLRPNQVMRVAESDGLMSQQAYQALMIKFADCTPIVLFDPVRRVQATIHSGWRSTQKKISQKAIQQLQAQFQCQLTDLLAYIGPTIDQAHYEVGQEVYQAFEAFPYRDDFFIEGEKEGKYLLSMQDANRLILEEAGINQSQIEIANISTYTHPELHSARRQGSQYGLNAMVTMLVD